MKSLHLPLIDYLSFNISGLSKILNKSSNLSMSNTKPMLFVHCSLFTAATEGAV